SDADDSGELLCALAQSTGCARQSLDRGTLGSTATTTGCQLRASFFVARGQRARPVAPLSSNEKGDRIEPVALCELNWNPGSRGERRSWRRPKRAAIRRTERRPHE